MKQLFELLLSLGPLITIGAVIILLVGYSDYLKNIIK